MAAFVPRTLGFGIGFPAVLAAGFVGSVALFYGSQVPQPMTMVWGPDGPVRHTDLAGFLWTAGLTIFLAGAIPGVLAAVDYLPPRLQRGMLGVAVAGTLFMAAIFAATLMGQVDLPPGTKPGIDPLVLGMGSGAAVALGIIMMFVYKPSELPPPGTGGNLGR